MKWPRKCGCPRQNINHSLEKLNSDFDQAFFLRDARVNYQFKTSELKNLGKLVEQTVQALKSWFGLQMDCKCAFLNNL